MKMSNDLVAGHEAIRVRAPVRSAREAYGPVGRDQRERVPASAPGRADRVALEDHMLDAVAGQEVADGQTSLPTSDDHDRGRTHDSLL
jgi:hypothetical protein